jgi:hypothetical protein
MTTAIEAATTTAVIAAARARTRTTATSTGQSLMAEDWAAALRRILLNN